MIKTQWAGCILPFESALYLWGKQARNIISTVQMRIRRLANSTPGKSGGSEFSGDHDPYEGRRYVVCNLGPMSFLKEELILPLSLTVFLHPSLFTSLLVWLFPRVTFWDSISREKTLPPFLSFAFSGRSRMHQAWRKPFHGSWGLPLEAEGSLVHRTSFQTLNGFNSFLS